VVNDNYEIKLFMVIMNVNNQLIKELIL